MKTIAFLEEEVDRPTSLKTKLNVPILNALWRITTGQTFQYNDPKLMEVVRRIETMFSSTNVTGALSLMPWLKHVIPDQLGYTVAMEALEGVKDLVMKSYKEHIDTFQVETL